MRFAFFADSDIESPQGYWPFPVFERAKELGANEFCIIGDHPHANAVSPAALTAMHDDRDALARLYGLPVGHTHEVWDDHDFARNNASHAAPSRTLALDFWAARRPMLPDHLLPTCIAQCGDLGLANDGRPLVRLLLLDLRAERYTAWTNRTILGPVQKPLDQGSHRTLTGALAPDCFQRHLESDALFRRRLVVRVSGRFRRGCGRSSKGATRSSCRATFTRAARLMTARTRSGFPELSVPRMNEECFVAASAGLGQWTMAAPAPYQPGFGLIDFSETEAVMQVRGPDGDVRLSLAVPVAVPA